MSMETVLTAVATRLLKKFVKRTDGQGEDLRVRLTNGAVVLHNLELNLAALGLGGESTTTTSSSGRIAVRRAFAKELSLTIPWTALSTGEVEVCLDTVEVLVDLNRKGGEGGSEGAPGNDGDEAARSGEGAEENEDKDTDSGGGGPLGWVGKALESLGDMRVRVRNLVLRLRGGGGAEVTLMCGDLKVFTSFQDERTRATDDAREDLGLGLLNPKFHLSKWIVVSTVMCALQGSEEPLLCVDRALVHVTQPSAEAIHRASSHHHHHGNRDTVASASEQEGEGEGEGEEAEVARRAAREDPSVRVFVGAADLGASPAALEVLVALARGKAGAGAAPGAEVGGQEPDGWTPDNAEPPTREDFGSAEPEVEAEEGEAGEVEGPNQRPSTWLSFGSSVASKTWDFISAGEGDEWEGEADEWGSPELTQQEREAKARAERRLKTLWRRFAMSVECQAVSASLKPVQVRVLGLEGGFQYDGDGDGARGLFVGARELGVLGGEEGPALEVSPGEGQDQGVRCDCGEAGTSGWSVGLGEAKYTHDSVLLGRAAEVLSSVRAALAGRGDVVNDADVDEKDYEEKGEGRALEVDVSAIGLTLRRLDSPLGCRLEGLRLKAATGGAGAGAARGFLDANLVLVSGAGGDFSTALRRLGPPAKLEAEAEGGQASVRLRGLGATLGLEEVGDSGLEAAAVSAAEVKASYGAGGGGTAAASVEGLRLRATLRGGGDGNGGAEVVIRADGVEAKRGLGSTGAAEMTAELEKCSVEVGGHGEVEAREVEADLSGGSAAVAVGSVTASLGLGDVRALQQVAKAAARLAPERPEDEDRGKVAVEVRRVMVALLGGEEEGELTLEGEGWRLEAPAKDASLEAEAAAVRCDHESHGGERTDLFRVSRRPGGRGAAALSLRVTSEGADAETSVRLGGKVSVRATPGAIALPLSLLAALSSPPAKVEDKAGAHPAKDTTQNMKSQGSCLKANLPDGLDLKLLGFHHGSNGVAGGGEGMSLRSEGVRVAAYPGSQGTEVDVCTMSFAISGSRHLEGGLRTLPLLGPADLRWRWQGGEAMCLGIECGDLPLQLLWPAHRVVPSALYGLFRTAYDGYQRIKRARRAGSLEEKESGEVQEEKEKDLPPFLVVALRAERARLDLQARQPEPPSSRGGGGAGYYLGTALAVALQSFHLGFHFWSSSQYLFTMLSQCELRSECAEDLAEETLLANVPVRASLGFDYRPAAAWAGSKEDLSDASAARGLDPSSFTPEGLLLARVPEPGVSVEALVDGTAHVVLTPATMRKIRNFSAVTSESEGLVVKNRTDLELWVSQEGCAGRGAARVEPMGEARFHWRRPRSLVKGLEHALVLALHSSKGDDVAEGCGGLEWSEGVCFGEPGWCGRVLLPRGGSPPLELAARVAGCARGGSVVLEIRPFWCLLNLTPLDLEATVRHASGGESASAALSGSGGSAASRSAGLALGLAADDAHTLSVARGPLSWGPSPISTRAGFALEPSGQHHFRPAALFCEPLPLHLDTGQVLLRIHPPVYVTNDMDEDATVVAVAAAMAGKREGEEQAVAVAAGSNTPVCCARPYRLRVACLGREALLQEEEESGAAGRWREASLACPRGVSPPLACLVLTEGGEGGSPALLRVAPARVLRNCLGREVGVSVGGEKRASLPPGGASMDALCGGDWRLAFDLGGEVGGADLEDLGAAGPRGGGREAFHWRVEVGAAAVVHVAALRTTTREGLCSLEVSLHPLHSVLNLCGEDLRVECDAGGGRGSGETCSPGELTPTPMLACQEAGRARVRFGLCRPGAPLSAPTLLGPGPGYSMAAIPLPGESPKGNLALSCYTTFYGGRLVTAVWEEKNPPFCLANESGGGVECWLTNRAGATPEDIREGESFVVEAGSAEHKDFGHHFCHALAAAKAEATFRPNEDLASSEREALLSTMNRVPVRNEIALYFRRQGDQGLWSRHVLGSASCRAAGGLQARSWRAGPTWEVVVCGEGDGEGDGGGVGEAEEATPRSARIHLRRAQVTLLAGEGRRVQVSAGSVYSRIARARDGSQEVEATWESFQAGIGWPSQAVAWQGSDPRAPPKSRIFAAYHVLHGGLLCVRDALVSVRRVSCAVDDACLDLVSALGPLFQDGRSGRLPLSEFCDRDGAAGRAPQQESQDSADVLARALSPALGEVHVNRLRIDPIELVLTFTSSGRVPWFPYALQVTRSPIALPPLAVEDCVSTKRGLADALCAYYAAEGMANAPRLLGSLGLLFNPVGIAHGITEGARELVLLPWEAAARGSPLGVAKGIGLGSLKFLGHVSGSLLSSVQAFSSATAGVLRHLYYDREAKEQDPLTLLGLVASPLGAGFQLIGDVAAGVLEGAGYVDALEDAIEDPRGEGWAGPRSARPRFLCLCAEMGLKLEGHFWLSRAAWRPSSGENEQQEEDPVEEAVLVVTTSSFALVEDGVFSFERSLTREGAEVGLGEGGAVSAKGREGEISGVVGPYQAHLMRHLLGLD